MKRILILLFLVPFAATSQNKPLVIEGSAPNLYITHTVAPKENYYSVGRMYNISPKEIAPFNNLELEKGLSLNQVVKVPLTTTNFSQDAAVTADEVLIPVYYVVKEKEGLYRISANYNKLPVETLKQWNKIKGDAVSNGTKLIVGYLKVKKDLSPLSGMAKPVVPVAGSVATVKENVPVTKTVKEAAKPDISNETLPVVKKPEEKAVVINREEKPATEIAKKETSSIAGQEEKTKPAPIRKGKNFNGGFFKSLFSDQSKGGDISNETGTAAIFKSTSGWEDGKYYCLHNTASSGTIIKITNPATGKSIYAKVLDAMPDIKQNTGLLIRLSNAAAAELGSDDNKFDCTLSYSK